MKHHLRIYTLLLLVVFIGACQGQDKTVPPKDSNLISASYGPTTITRNIKQDKAGKLLIASYEGIIRYDPAAEKAGSNPFTNFTKEEGLDTCYAFDVLEDKKGNLWIASNLAGAYRYDPSDGQAGFTHFTTKEGLAHNRLIDIYEDKPGNIWFATQGGVSRYNPAAERKGKNPFRNFTTTEGLPHNDVNVIIEDKTGKFWIGTGNEACIYDPAAEQEGKKPFTILTNYKGVPFKNVRSIIEDKKGNIWLGGGDGLWRYNSSIALRPGDNPFTNYSTDFVGSVYEDKKGNIWTTNKAAESHKWELSRYDEKTLLDENATATQIFIDDGMFFGIAEDEEGSIWVGTLKGVFRYDLSAEKAGRKSIKYFKAKEDQN